ncbi:M-phase inducer phosphatase [Fusarium oxysporum f. sp. albedinis]|nr:M-phase inducer phosphatase [Fusarium oxysporum f. sp. albedinis]
MSSSKMLRMWSGQPKLQKSVLREVEGHRGRNVAGSRSRNVEEKFLQERVAELEQMDDPAVLGMVFGHRGAHVLAAPQMVSGRVTPRNPMGLHFD